MIKLTVFLLLFVISISFTATVMANKSIISIPLNQWTSQRVISLAIGELLSKQGEQVEFIDISVDEQWGALQRGTVHFQLEVWQPSMAKVFTKLVEKTSLLDMGVHDAKVTEDWWYPKYLEKLCPELPDWRALITCKSLFVTRSSRGQGVYYTGAWDYNDADIIRALRLDYQIDRSPNEAVLWQKLSNAIKQQQPILILNWSPNWTDEHLTGQFIEFPPYSPECETVPEWGINKQLTKDCANPKDGWLKKAAWPKLKQYNLCVYEFIKEINLTNQMIIDATSLVVVDKINEIQAARAWSKKYQLELMSWLKNTCLISH